MLILGQKKELQKIFSHKLIITDVGIRVSNVEENFKVCIDNYSASLSRIISDSPKVCVKKMCSVFIFADKAKQIKFVVLRAQSTLFLLELKK